MPSLRDFELENHHAITSPPLHPTLFHPHCTHHAIVPTILMSARSRMQPSFVDTITLRSTDASPTISPMPAQTHQLQWNEAE
mmetsp:Transcript_895/g.1745  ORF Transcript_895/g.1745 Transcript_895/m.1745 type:complete len:82 (+) Transcript_895:29-274(+)